MPKVSKVGQFRKTAAAEQSSALQPKTPIISASDQASRGQRKRQAKRDQYLKRQNLVLSALQLKRTEDQKTRIDGLDALKEALMQTNATKTTAVSTTELSSHSLLGKNKSKRELTAREVNHLELVLEHPAFQANPFATIQEHLKNTLFPQKQILEQEAMQRNKATAARLEQTKIRKKEQQQSVGGKHRKKYTAARKSIR